MRVWLAWGYAKLIWLGVYLYDLPGLDCYYVVVFSETKYEELVAIDDLAGRHTNAENSL